MGYARALRGRTSRSRRPKLGRAPYSARRCARTFRRTPRPASTSTASPISPWRRRCLLLDLFDAALADRAEALALDDLTYRQLHDGSRRVARKFRTRHPRGRSRRDLRENRQASSWRTWPRCAWVRSRCRSTCFTARAIFPRALRRAAGDCRARPRSAPFPQATGDVVPCRCGRGRNVGADPSFAPRNRATVSPTTSRSSSTPAARPAPLKARCSRTATSRRSRRKWSSHGAGNRRRAAGHAAALPHPRAGRGADGTLAAGARVVLRERFDVSDVLDNDRAGDGDDVLRRADDVRAASREAAGGRAPAAVRLYVSGSAALSRRLHRAFEERFGA